MTALYATTGDDVIRLDHADGAWHARVALPGLGAQCVAAERDTVYVGTRGNGVRASHDGGETWRDLELPERDVFSLAVSPADGALYAGSEPSRLFRSLDGGNGWEALDALLELPSRPTWSFPPRPWTSHVRWIAPSPYDADLLLVGIELGGLMRTTDGGRTWQDHRPGAQPDVHCIAWHPTDAGRAYEAGGGGTAWSTDGGETWQPADDGRDRHYAWALAADPDDAETWFVSASTGPFAAHRDDRHAEAYVYRRCGSAPWEALDGGLPQPLEAMPYVLLFAGGRLFAGLRDGRLFASADRGDTWEQQPIGGAALQSIVALAPAAG